MTVAAEANRSDSERYISASLENQQGSIESLNGPARLTLRNVDIAEEFVETLNTCKGTDRAVTLSVKQSYSTGRVLQLSRCAAITAPLLRTCQVFDSIVPRVRARGYQLPSLRDFKASQLQPAIFRFISLFSRSKIPSWRWRYPRFVRITE